MAASGGADSTALLLGLAELVAAGRLTSSVVVAHLDHGLRKVSKQDAAWVIDFAKSLGFETIKRRKDVQKLATRTGDNLEQAARRARYAFLKTTAKQAGSTVVLTAHTLDDQAETIMMRLLRGSAAEGLSGIEAVRSLDAGSDIRLARPLLGWARRDQIEQYCQSRRVEFRRDEMNGDEKFGRVRVRKQLLPLMETFNSRIVEALSRTALLLREDAGALSADAENLLTRASEGRKDKSKLPFLNVNIMAGAPVAVRRRALRQWILRERGHLRRLEMVHLLSVDGLLVGNRGARTIELPDGAKVVRNRGWLELVLGTNVPSSRKKS